MIDRETRTAILRLHEANHSARKIAKAMGVSRNTVRDVVISGEVNPPEYIRGDQLAPYRERIVALHQLCKGNLIRVAEELHAEQIPVAYSTLTAFCRRNGIGVKPKKRVGHYHFEPGEEMQHDTSPHRVQIGGRVQLVHCASAVLCYSRYRYIQCFSRWNRFLCKVFLTEAFRYFDGAPRRTMLDNSHVIVRKGTGENAEMAPEMIAFGDRFGTQFVAHEKGDANRSARVERYFHEVENNFYAGRTFTDLEDLNRQQVDWCDKKNATWRRTLQASAKELFVIEKPALKPLPLYIPEVYDVHTRRVTTDGYVYLHRNRYSMPEDLIGVQVTLHEYRRKLDVYRKNQLIVAHRLVERGAGQRVTLPEHRYKRTRKPEPPLPEEVVLRAADPALGALVEALRKRHGGQAARAVRQLHQLYLDYPTEAVVDGVRTALDYGLLQVSRIERIVLRRIAGDYFQLQPPNTEDGCER